MALLAALVSGVVVVGTIVTVARRGNDASPGPSASASASAATANRWVRIDPVATAPDGKPWLLGLDSDSAPPTVRGFRPSRKIAAPTAPYEIQQHEVTWAELEQWLAKNPASAFPRPPRLPVVREKLAPLPATGVPWAVADAYCKSIGAALPSEEQWEYAARGADRRKFPWGADKLDPEGTQAFVGLDGKPAAVMTSAQDRTPSKDDPIHDLAGNAREWTGDAYRDESDDKAPRWNAAVGMVFHVVRGLPLMAPSSGLSGIGDSPIAYREAICTSDSDSAGCSGAPLAGHRPTTLLWSLGSAILPEDGSASRRAVAQWVHDFSASNDLGACFGPSGSSASANLTLAYSGPRMECWAYAFPRPNAKSRADGIPAVREENVVRCADIIDQNYGWRAFPSQLKVRSEGKADSVEMCVQRMIEASLKGVVLPPDKAAWNTPMLITRIAPQPASALHDVGFRCARPVGAK